MRNIIKPTYYDSFRCIADQCSFNCCQGWSISVDENTFHKWKSVKLDTLGLGNGKEPELTLCDCLEKEDSDYVISLEEDKRCPFLNKKQLCKLVLELGEDFLSQTCTRFPRYINKFDDRDEYSLDFGCPAVIDLMSEKLDGIQFINEGVQERTPSLAYEMRQMILDIVQNERYSLTERIMMIFYCLLELLEDEDITKETIEGYKSSEYLDAVVSEIRIMEFDLMDSFWERNELFLDIVQLYRKEEAYVKYLENISVWAERMEEYYSDTCLLEKNQIFEAKYIAYEKLLNNYLVAEIWGNCLASDMNVQDMVMVFEWIILEYCAIKQAIFLKWLSKEEQDIEYNMVRDYIMIISRMAGYSQSDIKKYLEDSFDSTILKWGHLALIIGNGKM